MAAIDKPRIAFALPIQANSDKVCLCLDDRDEPSWPFVGVQEKVYWLDFACAKETAWKRASFPELDPVAPAKQFSKVIREAEAEPRLRVSDFIGSSSRTAIMFLASSKDQRFESSIHGN